MEPVLVLDYSGARGGDPPRPANLHHPSQPRAGSQRPPNGLPSASYPANITFARPVVLSRGPRRRPAWSPAPPARISQHRPAPVVPDPSPSHARATRGICSPRRDWRPRWNDGETALGLNTLPLSARVTCPPPLAQTRRPWRASVSKNVTPGPCLVSPPATYIFCPPCLPLLILWPAIPPSYPLSSDSVFAVTLVVQVPAALESTPSRLIAYTGHRHSLPPVRSGSRPRLSPRSSSAMPGILPMKVIRVGNSSQSRIAQACDRCRSK